MNAEATGPKNHGTMLLSLLKYGAWFIVVFVVGLYLTFPIDDFKPVIISQLENELGKGKQDKFGIDPKVTIGSLGLSGFVGVKAERVSIQLASKDPDPGPVIDIDDVAVSIRPWALLMDNKAVHFAADLYEGSIAGVVAVDEKGVVDDLDVTIDDLDLSKAIVVQTALGLPMTGVLDADVDVHLGKTPEKDGDGDIKLKIANLSVGPGSPKAAAALGGFGLPQVDLGTLNGEIPVKQGKGVLQGVKLDGKDVQMELEGELNFKGKLMASRLDLSGWFFPTPALFEKDAKLKTLIDLGESLGGSGGPSLSKAKDDEGHYHFGIKGTMASPAPSLSRDGKKAKSKTNKDKVEDAAPPPAEIPG